MKTWFRFGVNDKRPMYVLVLAITAAVRVLARTADAWGWGDVQPGGRMLSGQG